ncbi:hypothetical protein AVEN_206641-1 [Araneus ventricosus]|uniref:Uncharacterized protein n=1 Tax=Araneus ventricosus TaxID=182803 RepID=A0A4Y2H2U1_ARAVE|nr:hypothetical protein AVEN_206641-1 [Araneus ventricosus]
MKHIPFVFLTLDRLFRETREKKEKLIQFKQPLKSDINKRFLFQYEERNEIWPVKGVGHSSGHLYLTNVDSDTDKEAAGMAYDHHQI